MRCKPHLTSWFCGVELGLKPTSNMVSELKVFFWHFFFVAPVAAIAATIIIAAVAGVSVPTGGHTVLIALAKRPQRRQNRRHQSSDAPSRAV